MEHNITLSTDPACDAKEVYPAPNERKWHLLQVPITENCNLLCKHCLRTEKFLRKDFSIETFKDYLSKFSPDNFDSLLLSDYGEPLVRADLVEILRCAKSLGFNHTQIVTTGTLLTESWIKTIVDEDLLQKILISTEAASKELYEFIRGADYDLMKHNIKSLTDYKKKTGSKYPEMFLNVVCMKDNINELSATMDLAHELGFNHVYYVHLNGITATKGDIEKDKQLSNNIEHPLLEKIAYSENHLNACNKNLIQDVFLEINQKSEEYKIPFDPPEDYFSDPGKGEWASATGCRMPYEWVQVGPEGDVYPCCQIAQQYSLGNLNDVSDFESVWNSERYQNFRDGLKNGNPIDRCAVCNVYNGKRF